MLERVGLDPILLEERASKGRTVIEKVDEHSEAQCAVVLLSGDDVGYASGKPRAKKARARQNVIFELGFFLGRHGREGVIALYEDGVEIPSNYTGVVYIQYDSGAWKAELVRELKERGYPVDVNGLV